MGERVKSQRIRMKRDELGISASSNQGHCLESLVIVVKDEATIVLISLVLLMVPYICM